MQLNTKWLLCVMDVCIQTSCLVLAMMSADCWEWRVQLDSESPQKPGRAMGQMAAAGVVQQACKAHAV